MNDILHAVWSRLPEWSARFQQARQRYQPLQDETRRQAVGKVWARAPRFTLEPFGIERMSGGNPGQLLKSRPGVLGTAACCLHALDGRVLCEERYTGNGTCYEEFVEYGDTEVRSTLFDYYSDKDVINVQSLFLQDRQPAAFIRYAAFGAAAESYVFNDGRLVRAYMVSQDHNGPRDRMMMSEDTFVYNDADDRLVGVVRKWEDGTSETIYPRQD